MANVLPLGSLGFASVLLLASFAAAAESGSERVEFRGLSLEQAIKVLERDGLAVIYSNALVKPWMRIRDEPAEGTPDQMLEEILAPFGLRARATPHGVVAVVRAPPARASAVTYSVEPVWYESEPRDGEVPLEQIVVAASRYELTRTFGEPDMSLSGTDIEHLPDLGDDSLRAVGRLPGAASNGLSARTNVRGGEANETLVRLDGLRLYNPFHLKDFQSVFSAIDPRIVSSVEVYTGGFAARYGDRISGVFDITSLVPPAPRYREISVSFFNTSALSAGRFAEDRGSWVASFRRSNLDVWYHALSDTPGTPAYADAFAKVSYDVSPRLRVTASTLYFTDEISLTIDDHEERADADYRDQYHWVRLDHRVNDFLAGATVLSSARLRSDRAGVTAKDGVSRGSLRDERSFDIDSVASDWAWRVGEDWLVEFGGELKRARGSYDFSEEVEFDLLLDTSGAPGSAERSRAIRLEPRRTQEAVHAAVRHGISPRVTTDIGVRWESDRLSPRFGARLSVTPRTFVRMSLGRIYQSHAIDELQVPDGLTSFSRPQRADYVSLGLDHRFERAGVGLRAEVYEKRLRHLPPRYENLLNTLTLVPELNPDRGLVAPTRGRAHGFEMLLSGKDEGPLSWWAGYSWSSVKERLDGVDVFRAWDQTHAVSAGINWTRNDWTIGAALIHRSGWPMTTVSLESEEPTPLLKIGGRNAERAPVYRSLDLRAERRFALEHSQLSVFAEIVNALNRGNMCCVAYEIDDEGGGLELERRNYLPRVPSLGFLWQF